MAVATYCYYENLRRMMPTAIVLYFLNCKFVKHHTVKNFLFLKVRSCKLYNKYKIDSKQITSTEILKFIASLVFKLLSREVLFEKLRRQ